MNIEGNGGERREGGVLGAITKNNCVLRKGRVVGGGVKK